MYYKRTWKPIAIEEFYKDYPDKLKMWKALEIVEENRVPIYADEPIARSKKFNLGDFGLIHRYNFRPEENWNHLIAVAKAIDLEEITIDLEEANKRVIAKIDEMAHK